LSRLPLHYPNLVLFLFSIGLTIILARLGFFQFLVHLPSLGYLGAFISGLLLPFTFAAPLATAGFFYLGALDNFWLVALLGGLGALLSDLLIFSFFQGGLFRELEAIWHNHGRRLLNKDYFVKLFHTKPFYFISLFTAALIILSPFPDELGIAILAYYRVRPARFVPLSFLLNSLGIWLVVGIGYMAFH
jgi:hypothetical protein